MQTKKYLRLSNLLVFIFLAVVLYYIVSPVYIGMLPIGIITGITLLAQIVLLVFSARSLLKGNIQWQSIVSVVIEVISIFAMGYFFLVWLIII